MRKSCFNPSTLAEQRSMLKTIGVNSIDELFAIQIPHKLLLQKPLALPAALSEPDLIRHMEKMAALNDEAIGKISFMGGGAYRHWSPAAVDYLIQRGELMTSYTPYQAEASQATLKLLFTFQQCIAELTGMDIANSSLYDGASSLVEAVLMAQRAHRKGAVLISRNVHPEYRQTLNTFAGIRNIQVTELPCNDKGATLYKTAGSLKVSAVVVQYPNFFGVIEDLKAARLFASEMGALLIVVVNEPIALALLGSPGNFGADIVCGEGQAFGLPLSFGGPYLGIFAARKEFVSQMPGRLIGRTQDIAGQEAFAITLATREQHIVREKATSNICTNQTLMAHAATLFMLHHGGHNLRWLAYVNAQRAAYAKKLLTEIEGISAPYNAPVFNEFVIRTESISAQYLLEVLREKRFNIFAGLPLRQWYTEHENDILVSVTELNSKDEIEEFARSVSIVLGCGTKLPASDGKQNFRKVHPVPLGVPSRPLHELIPRPLQRRAAIQIPHKPEAVLVREVTNSSHDNMSIDTNFYPLGSCTMKYNPRVNEKVARLNGFARLHPLTPAEYAQGALKLMQELGTMLCEICGMHAVTLAPAAGAHGELTGLLMVRAALKARGENKRTRIIIPDSAHGTNPASAVFAGFNPTTVKSGPHGILELKDIAPFMDDSLAAIMITNPNTLGLFEKNIAEIARMVHTAGGYVYCDGANLNALVGMARPGDAGVDALQINLHKTFSTPHGGGGPGAGPVVVSKALADFLPVPHIVQDKNGMYIVQNTPQSIGRVRSFFANYGMLIRAYAYIMSHGHEGLRDVARTAVLNANYMMARLKAHYETPFAENGCMHEFIITEDRQRKESKKMAKQRNEPTIEILSNDIPKTILDFGFHAPTTYFPTNIPNCLLIEPTETEDKSTMDKFVEAMAEIARIAQTNPAMLKEAPRTTSVRRVKLAELGIEAKKGRCLR